MKKTSIILYISIIAILIAICKPANSQTYIPIPLDSTIWKVKIWAGLPWPYGWDCNIYEHTAGDTIINGKSYTLIKMLYDSFCATHVSPIFKSFAIRQDSLERKVYVIRLPDSLTERIMYDFTQTTGDTCNSVLCPDAFSCGYTLIQSVDSIYLINRFHKRINLNGGCCMASLIEGIGSTYGLVDRLFIFESGSDLECVRNYKNGNIFTFPNFSGSCDTANISISEYKSENYSLNVYPNPIIDQIIFEYTSALKNIHIYNLLGQEIYYLKIDNKNNVQLDIKGLPESIFIYRVETIDERVFIGKLVKE
jgi:hypothetical protein